MSELRFYDAGGESSGGPRALLVLARRAVRRLLRPYFLRQEAILRGLDDDLAAREHAVTRLEHQIRVLEHEYATIEAARRAGSALLLDVARRGRRMTGLERVVAACRSDAADRVGWRSRVGEPAGGATPGARVRIDAGHAVAPRCRVASRGRRLRVLVVLPSSNQMYSGIGRNVFESARALADRAEYEFAIDDVVARNTDLVVEFGRKHGLKVNVGRGRRDPAWPDPVNDDLAALLDERRWDVVETTCWAAAGTNEAVLAGVGDASLCYTPHNQPLSTVPFSPDHAAKVEAAHRRMLVRADVVCCDSPWERDDLSPLVGPATDCAFVPIGCDFNSFAPGPKARKKQLLFVGDLLEPRKRFDRVLDVFSRVLDARPDFKLVVIGNRSDALAPHLPKDVAAAIETRGYVSEAELRAAYAESFGLILMSEFEAFGIPILEALATGTPVFLAQQDATESLFGRFLGTYIVSGEVRAQAAEVIVAAIDRGEEPIVHALADRARLRAAFDWNVAASTKWRSLAAAWFRRHGFEASRVSESNTCLK